VTRLLRWRTALVAGVVLLAVGAFVWFYRTTPSSDDARNYARKHAGLSNITDVSGISFGSCNKKDFVGYDVTVPARAR
jgi:hypothetical protein